MIIEQYQNIIKSPSQYWIFEYLTYFLVTTQLDKNEGRGSYNTKWKFEMNNTDTDARDSSNVFLKEITKISLSLHHWYFGVKLGSVGQINLSQKHSQSNSSDQGWI